MKYLIIIIVLFSTPVYAKDYSWLKENKIYSLSNTQKWDKWDKGLYISFSILMTIDCLQTRDILYHNQKERFHLEKHFNKDTVPIVFIGCIFSSYIIATHLKPKPRKVFLTIINILDFRLVNKNKQIGLKLKF